MEIEKKEKVQENQLDYREEQIESLNITITDLRKELKQERQSHKASVHAVEEIKRMMGMSPINSTRRRELQEEEEEENSRTETRPRGMEELLKENRELKRTIDILNGRVESNVDEFVLQKSELENRVKEVERHYREKQLQDEFNIATLKSSPSNEFPYLLAKKELKRLRTRT